MACETSTVCGWIMHIVGVGVVGGVWVWVRVGVGMDGCGWVWVGGWGVGVGVGLFVVLWNKTTSEQHETMTEAKQ